MEILVTIDSLRELYDFFDGDIPDTHGSEDWCYVLFITNTGLLHKDIPVVDFLEIVTKECTEKILNYSVTSDEPRYEEWVQAALDLQPIGATVTVLDRGNRFVYLCSIPTTPQELM